MGVSGEGSMTVFWGAARRCRLLWSRWALVVSPLRPQVGVGRGKSFLHGEGNLRIT